MNSSASRVLPIPASPTSTTVRLSPRSTRAHSSASAANSCFRPTNGGSRNTGFSHSRNSGRFPQPPRTGRLRMRSTNATVSGAGAVSNSAANTRSSAS